MEKRCHGEKVSVEKRCQWRKGVRNLFPLRRQSGEKVSATVLESQADCAWRHGWRSLRMALRVTRSLRMAAVSASFLALPVAIRR